MRSIGVHITVTSDAVLEVVTVSFWSPGIAFAGGEAPKTAMAAITTTVAKPASVNRRMVLPLALARPYCPSRAEADREDVRKSCGGFAGSVG